MPDAIPISLCIDVEPDDRRINPLHQSRWVGFEHLFVQMVHYRKQLERATGSPVHFSWNLRLDPQIEHTYGSADWVIDRYPGLLDEARNAGDAIGVHAHAWRWAPEHNDWLQDHGNPGWVEHCARLSCGVYKARFGVPTPVFAFGDRFMSNEVMQVLDELGIACDVTLEPGKPAVSQLVDGEQATGMLPAQFGVPRTPYQPSISNFKRRGVFKKRKIWVVPVTTGRPEGLIPGLPYPPPRCLALTVGFPFEAMAQILEQNLNRLRKPYILANARTDVPLDTFNNDQFNRFMNHLAEHPLRKDFVFTTPMEALRILGHMI